MLVTPQNRRGNTTLGGLFYGENNWSYDDGDYVSGISPHLQKDLETDDDGNSVANCTLTCLATIFEYYHDEGYNGESYNDIPSSITKIYADVRSIAVGYGYTPEDGTPPTKIDNIAEDCWEKWGYDGSATNDYLITTGDFKTEIENDRQLSSIQLGEHMKIIQLNNRKNDDIRVFFIIKEIACAKFLWISIGKG